MTAHQPDYYMLECSPPRGADDHALVRLVTKPPSGAQWKEGARFSVDVPEPVEFAMRANHNDLMLEMNNTQGLLVTKRLLAALQEAGVDNLDVYDAVIRHESLGTERRDYVAVNLIGTVSAADLSRSTVVPGGLPGNLIDTDFEGVAIDPEKAGGMLMFRLAENTSAIVVHERVKEHLESKGFDMLTFVPPESWIG